MTGITVQGAPRLAPAYGLNSVVSWQGLAEPWTNGVQFEALPAPSVKGFGAYVCGETQTLSFADGAPGPWGNANAINVYATFKCGPVGYSMDAAQALANTSLLTYEESVIEHALWTGDLGNHPSLSPDADSVGTFPHLSAAIGALENHIASSYGSVGVMHMTRQAALVALSRGVLSTSGGRLYTALGTPCIAGSGYPGTGPGGAEPAAGKTWLYGSPALFGIRSDAFSPGPQFHYGTNDLQAIAMRTALLGFDPHPVGAVLSDLA